MSSLAETQFETLSSRALVCEPRRPGLVGPPGFHTTAQEPKREKEERKLWRKGKKARNFGPPTLRGPTLLCSTLLGSTLLGSTFSRFGPPPFGAPFEGPTLCRPKIQHPKIGRNRNWLKLITPCLSTLNTLPSTCPFRDVDDCLRHLTSGPFSLRSENNKCKNISCG